jgi:hypothetical protein
MLRHPPRVQLTLQRLGGGAASYRVLAWREYQLSVPAGRYTVSEGIAAQPALTTVQTGRTNKVDFGLRLNCL